MTIAPIAIRPHLVEPSVPAVPTGFTDVDVPLVKGLPHRIPLVDGFALVLAVPTGVARAWRDADPAAVVSASGAESLPPARAAAIGDVDRAPVRLYLERQGATLAVVPLAAGLRRRIPDAGIDDQGAAVEVLIVGWDIRAGTLRGPGDVGSRLHVGWRDARVAADTFERPPLLPGVAERIAREEAA
jgi:hypothetical protein